MVKKILTGITLFSFVITIFSGGATQAYFWDRTQVKGILYTASTSDILLYSLANEKDETKEKTVTELVYGNNKDGCKNQNDENNGNHHCEIITTYTRDIMLTNKLVYDVAVTIYVDNKPRTLTVPAGKEINVQFDVGKNSILRLTALNGYIDEIMQ